MPRAYLSAAAGIVTVLLVYLLGRRLFDETTGLASAVFLAVAFLHVRDSHFGVTDVAMTMLLTLAVVLLIAAHDRAREASGDAGRFAAAGLVAGLAASTKYNAILLVAPAVVAAGLLWPAETAAGRVERTVRRLGAWGLAMAVGFLLGTPYAMLEPTRFWQDASSEAMHLRAGHTVLLGIGWTHHLTVTLWHGLTWPLLLCALTGAVWMAVRAPRRAALLLAFPRRLLPDCRARLHGLCALHDSDRAVPLRDGRLLCVRPRPGRHGPTRTHGSGHGS